MTIAALAGGRRIATARWAALGLAAIFGASSAYSESEKFWFDGTDGAAAVAGVAVLVVPVLATLGAAAVLLRRWGGRGPVRGDTGSGVGKLVEAVRLVLLFGQAGWATFMAGLLFSLTDLSPAQGVSWGLAILTFTEALGLLAIAWWAEDRLAARRRGHPPGGRVEGQDTAETRRKPPTHVTSPY